MIYASNVGMVGLSIKKNKERFSSQKNSNKGFTLVELIVVLVVLAIMAAAVIPALFGYTDYAKNKKYIETAKECLKASQSVLSDTFTDSGNTITREKRYSAADMAKVSTEDTSFYVWTAKRLEANGFEGADKAGTKAITDNQGAYTIVYAAYDTGTDKYVVYDGKDWTVKEKDNYDSSNPTNFDLAGKSDVPSSISDNIIHMWKYDDTDACSPAYYKVEEDWNGKEGVTLSRKVTLHFVNDKEDHGVVLANTEGGETISHDYSTYTLTLNFTKEDSVIACNECKNLRDGSEISVSGSKVYLKVEDDFSDLRWSTDFSTVGNRQWTESLDDLLSQIEFPQSEDDDEMEPMDIYAWTTKDIEKRTANFKVTNSGNLAPVGSVQSLTFCRYANKYDKESTDGGYTIIHNNNGATEGVVKDPTGQNGFSFVGWAHNTSDNTYEKDADNKLLSYSLGNETIWKAVFDTPEGVTPTFTAIGELNKNITFNTNDYSGFGTLTTKVLEVPIYKNDLTGEENDPDAIYNDAELKLDYGYRFKNWVEETSGTEFGLDFAPIKDYVIAGSEDSYVFNIETEKIQGAKIIGGTYTGSGNVPSSIRSLSGSSIEKVSLFIRDPFGDGVNALGGETGIFGDITTESSEDGRLLGNLSASGGNITSTISADNHIAIYGVNGGSISKAAVLWDGDDDTYQAPIFAYSKNVDGNTEIHWFCYDEENPHVFGNLSSTFNGFKNCNFAASDIENWDMSRCDNITSMFENCKALKTGDIEFSNWKDLSSVSSMAYLFKGCENLAFTAVDFTGANLSALTTMASWVDNCPNLQSITLDKVNSPQLTNISYIASNYTGSSSKLKYFYARGWKAGSINKFTYKNGGKEISYFSQKSNLLKVDLSGTSENLTDLHGVTSLTNMFVSDIALDEVLLEYVDFSGATESKFMFIARENDKPQFDDPVTYVSFKGSNLSSIQTVEGMFYHLKQVAEINLEGTGLAPTNCSRMFDKCFLVTTIDGLESMDTSAVTNMDNMFYQCQSMTEFDFTKFDYSSVTTMEKMLFDSGFEVINFTGKTMPHLANVNLMFGGTNVKESPKLTAYAAAKKVYFTDCKMPALASMKHLFLDNPNIEEVYFDGFESTSITDMSELFLRSASLKKVDFNGAKLTATTSIGSMFSGCSNLEEVYLKECDMSSVGSAAELFKGCTSLETVSANNWDLTSASSLKGMFSGCTNLSTVSLNGWIIPNVTTMENMFENSGITSVTMNNLEMPRVSTLYRMFYNCKSLTSITLTDWPLSNVTSINAMFENSSIETATFDSCNMESVNNISNLFKGCTSLTSFSGVNWKLSGISNLNNGLFSGVTSLSEVDLTGADLSGVTANYNIFNGCTGLTTVTLDRCNMSGITGGINTAFFSGCYALDTVSANGWNINNCTSLSNLFDGKTSLTTVSMTDMKIDHVKHNNGNAGFNSMFKGCTSLTTVTMNVTTTNMSPNQQALNYMFDGCTSLTSVQFVDIDFSKIERFQCIFNGCTSYTKESLENTISNWDYNQNAELFKEGNHKGNVGWNSLFNVGNCHESLRTGNKQEIIIRQGDKTFRWEIDGTYPKVKPNENPGHETRLNYYRDNEY